MSGHVILIGLSGSGKSTVAPLLSTLLDRPLYDTDTQLAARTGLAVPELLRRDEACFRRTEEEIVASLAVLPSGIVATGGGVVLSARNRAALSAGNRVIWLRAPVSVLVARLAAGDVTGQDRPLLTGDPAARLAALLREREGFYAACAHDTVETRGLSVGAVARRIQDIVLHCATTYAP